MYTQNTPIHVKLWHADFWRLAIANLLLTISIYLQIPALPQYLCGMATPIQGALVMGLFGVGIYLLGSLCSYFVQRYRRNAVCVWGMMGVLLSHLVIYCLQSSYIPITAEWWMLLVARIVMGACYGLAQMVLISTLIIDSCESFQRTEANHSAAWFGRFALSLAPMAALVIMKYTAPGKGYEYVTLVSSVCCILSILFIMMVNFPFKAPEDHLCHFSTDRFFLIHGTWLFVNLILCMTAVGMILTIARTPMFYAMMMVGFFLSLLSQKYVFVNAELRSEILTGLFLIGTSFLLLLSRQHNAELFLAPVFFGMGLGIVGARFLLFFIKLSNHCQRGTSQSTYFLAWETGIAMGMFLGLAFFQNDERMLLYIALILIVLSFLMYQLFTHSWYLKNKNR